MKELKQNSLADSTSDLDFLKVVNSNAEELGTTKKATLVREEELEDGTRVNVEGMTPAALKALLTEQGAIVKYETPGEPVEVTVKKEEGKIGPNTVETVDGIVQIYNKAVESGIDKKIIDVEIPDGQVQVLGLSVETLQENVTVIDNAISGTSKHVESFEQFSSAEEEQSGNYLALYFPEATRGETISVEIKGGEGPHSGKATLDEDGLYVCRLTDNTCTIEVTGEGKDTKTLTLNELELKSQDE